MGCKGKWVMAGSEEACTDDEYRAMSARLGVPPLLLKLAGHRGCRTEEELRTYFYGGLKDLGNPHLLKDADLSARIILDFISGHRQIGIASDYDVDGIFSAYILHQALARLGAESRIYTPDRVSEGYGLNRRIVSEAKDDGIELLITCDNGIAAVDAVEYAQDLGITTVVTDHHEVYYTEENGVRHYHPAPARAVVDPCQEDCPYPFKGLCGTAVIFKVIQIMYEWSGIADREWEELLPYVAFATVADVMDLVEENRVLVKCGFERMPRISNYGLRALMNVQGIAPEKLSAYHVGFVLGPCFNAAGRISSVQKAFDLLFSRNMDEAMTRALELKEINESRKEMTEKGTRRAEQIIEQEKLYENPVIVVYLPDCHESLAGIIAGRLKEKWSHPVFVITDGQNGLKGSGRSIHAYSMFEKLIPCQDLLLHFGGHPMAAGITIKEGMLDEFARRINQDTGLTEADFQEEVSIDAVIPIHTLSEKGIEMLDKLEPCGTANEKPLFADMNLLVRHACVRGHDRNVLALQVEDSSDCTLEAVYFDDIEEFDTYIRDNFGEEEYRAMYAGRNSHVRLALAYSPEINEFGDTHSIQLVVKNYIKC